MRIFSSHEGSMVAVCGLLIVWLLLLQSRDSRHLDSVVAVHMFPSGNVEFPHTRDRIHVP